ncbi:hypothetical protein NY2A_b885L [Paramecium bursaria Chlorella virus NY2A]|uniref:Uncharacterized protein b002R n=1 Tax=Paramecium bursaria Chlorella virus NY2A TaxID=46021 RepID=A7IVM7_PBCVN|nr:hypothetical protein NY2A_b002R [Paramecium bursaria Chlorella virus NY2A]YP_001498081.1 hypothetical protein NY2A_b885L [Paramecium bursaria Chlorella virus NY2A]YP_001498086.1 hypothetical protein AR158_c004R [Paramecium bursaria Chlorella virus AR158]ABT14401.1 hypothetical protein NY2A_b002R [Paramecium bursaria Chlorella virus NY2A]ABT15284.1 hypothetical protein NY2A_b885L [Paramecium bursaria Chlorella virus NY2A]ABU43550.1 hypothetical protein AR158_c004R [Paramecium bursaria Chlore
MWYVQARGQFVDTTYDSVFEHILVQNRVIFFTRSDQSRIDKLFIRSTCNSVVNTRTDSHHIDKLCASHGLVVDI